jgi:CheY-like chemotaxis protein
MRRYDQVRFTPMFARENFLRLELSARSAPFEDAEPNSKQLAGKESDEWPTPLANQPAGKAGRPLLVLVVDDSSSNRRILHDALFNRGHAVLLATNGRQAVQVWRTQAPNAILMDLQMPAMGGLEATVQIRAAEGNIFPRHRVPIIAVTQNHTAPDRVSALAAGVDDFLPKPTTATAVIETVERLVAPASDAAPSAPSKQEATP